MILNLSKLARAIPAAVLITVVAAVLASCGGSGGPPTSGEGIPVVATTTQIGALVREVSGGQVKLTVLLSAAADAHDYEPSPQSVKKLNQADLVLRNGLGIDSWLDATIKNAGGDARVVTVTDGIQVVTGKGGDPDPHVWHDPRNAKLMVDNIVAALTEADPPNAEVFSANGAAYKARLDDVDAEIRALIATVPAGNRKVVTDHDAFGYFLRAYDLEFVGAVIPSTAKEAQADARALAALEDLVREQGVKAIFAEAEVDPKVARELARDTRVRVVEGLFADSLGKPGSGADTVDGMLLTNARKIAEALR